MSALLIGLLFLCFGVYAVLPFSWALNWGPQVIVFLQGSVPFLAFLIGLIAIFIGFADMKDRAEAKKEEKKEEE